MMLEQDRRLRGDERPNLAIFLSWVVVSAIFIAMSAMKIVDAQLPGPDDSLRLVQVRDLLAGQGWYDLHQYRMTPPDGTLMHWSRLVDLPIAGLILFFSLFMDAPLAERAAITILPLLLLLLTMFAVGRLAWRLFDRQTAIYACLAMVVCALLAMQFQPLRIDHHGWQIFTIAFAIWAISWRSAGWGGAAAGLVMSLGMMISLEPIFMCAGFGLVLALRWLRDPRERWWLVSYLQALALGMVVLFALTRGLPDLAAHCDVIAPPHLGFFLIVALGASGLAAAPPMPRLTLALALGGIGLLGVGFVAWSAPQCLASPFAGLDPLVREYWYLNVTEGRPIWYSPIKIAIAGVVQPICAIAITLYLASRNHDWLRRFWFEYSILLGIAFLGGVMTFRSIAFAGVLCAIPLGWFIGEVLRRRRAHKRILPQLGWIVALYLILLPVGPLVLVTLATESFQNASPEKGSGISQSACRLHKNAPLLNQLEQATLFAPLDIGPAILVNTKHAVVASSHHRAEQAMRDVIESFISDADQAKVYVDRYNADYVVACLDLIEAVNFRAGANQDGFMTRLTNDDLPEWLEPVDIGGPEKLKVWRVVRN